MAEPLVTIKAWDANETDFVVPTPSTYVGETADIVDSARNAAGIMIGAVIRSDLAKVELTWRGLPASTWASICQRFNGTHSDGTPKFLNQVKFYNQITDTWETRKMYISDRKTGGAFDLDQSTGKVHYWTECRIALIEV